jgi:16S rRNA (cytidine1402-2'-O)-methyltransferase
VPPPRRPELRLGTLYLVPTPIGNLEDVTRRAARVLGEVDRVLAEDTRRTRVLLDHLGVSVPVVAVHEHNEAERSAQLLDWLGAGEALALVSDAGTPLVSDPGARVVRAVLDAGHEVIPLPGPSAVLAALIASGLSTERFSFLGFPPRKGEERRALLERIAASEETVVLFESPERLGALLSDLIGACGEERLVAVARELTKVHEEVTRGTLTEALRYYEEHPPRGEVTVVVDRASPSTGSDAADEIAARLLAQALLNEGLRPSHAAREVARRLGLSRNLAYQIVQALGPGDAKRGEADRGSATRREGDQNR